MANRKSIIIERTAKVSVSPQAQLLLEKCGVSVEDFVSWAMTHKGISYGGANVIEFIEYMERNNG